MLAPLQPSANSRNAAFGADIDVTTSAILCCKCVLPDLNFTLPDQHVQSPELAESFLDSA
jgi:hypothetical protein